MNREEQILLKQSARQPIPNFFAEYLESIIEGIRDFERMEASIISQFSDQQSVRFSEITEEAEAEMREWDAIFKGAKK